MNKLTVMILLSSITTLAHAEVSLTPGSLSDICQVSGGGELVNLSSGGQYLFLTDSEGVTHKTFKSNGHSIKFDDLSEFWQQEAMNGLKFNYDVYACLTDDGHILPNMGLFSSRTVK